MATKPSTVEDAAPEQVCSDGTEDCPHCGAAIPLPLKNFCAWCRYPLRIDLEERAAAIRAENARPERDC